jgi:hypothetical protein
VVTVVVEIVRLEIESSHLNTPRAWHIKLSSIISVEQRPRKWQPKLGGREKESKNGVLTASRLLESVGRVPGNYYRHIAFIFVVVFEWLERQGPNANMLPQLTAVHKNWFRLKPNPAVPYIAKKLPVTQCHPVDRCNHLGTN